MTNGTIDASFMAASAQTNRTALDNSAAKLYTSTESKAGTFSDYLDTAKQIYSDNSNSYSSNSNVISQNKDYYKEKDTKPIKSKDKTYDKENSQKVNDNNRDKDKKDDITTKDKEDKVTKDTVTTKEKDSSEKVSKDDKNEKPKEKEKEKDTNSETNDNAQKDDKGQTKDTKSSENNADGNKTVKSETDKTNIAANATNEAAKVADSIIQAAGNTQATDDKSKVATQNNATQGTTNNNTAENQPKIEVTLNTSETDVRDLVKNANSKEPKADLKTQTQQLIANLTQETGESTAKEAQNKLSQTATTPVIQTAEETNPTINVGKNTTGKENIKAILDKIGLTQDLIDKTNARITSVSANAQSSANFAGQQDAAEQSMKFSIEQASILSGDNKLGATGSQNGIETTFSKSLTSAQNGNSISDSEILSQINNRLSISQDTGESRITMILKPENLGRIHIELQNGKDGLTASLTAENSQVKEILDKNLDSLKSTLNNQGISVSSVNIKLEESQKQSQSDLNQNQDKNENQNQDHHGTSQEKNDGSNYKEQGQGQQNSEEEKNSKAKTLKFAKTTV